MKQNILLESVEFRLVLVGFEGQKFPNNDDKEYKVYLYNKFSNYDVTGQFITKTL